MARPALKQARELCHATMLLLLLALQLPAACARAGFGGLTLPPVVSTTPPPSAAAKQKLFEIADWIVRDCGFMTHTHTIPYDNGTEFNNTCTSHERDSLTLGASIFVNGDLARILMASYRLSKNGTYLFHALGWCDSFVAQQRTVPTFDGSGTAGYWYTGYAEGPGSKTPETQGLYLADTGTAVTALAVGYKLALEAAPARAPAYLQALTRFVTLVERGCKRGLVGSAAASPGWLISSGADSGALGCGYYEGALSLDAYTVGTSITGGCFLALMANITSTARLGTLADGAIHWLAQQVIAQGDGQVPLRIAGKPPKTTCAGSDTCYDAIAYATEGVVGASFYASPPDATAFNLTVRYLVRSQNADGSWGKRCCGDQLRSHRSASLLSWYLTRVGQDDAVLGALNRWVGAASAGQLCGLTRPFETISVGMIGLALADAIEFGVSF